MNISYYDLRERKIMFEFSKNILYIKEFLQKKFILVFLYKVSSQYNPYLLLQLRQEVGQRA